MAEESCLYDIIPPHSSSPRRARTLHYPPGHHSTAKVPTPPPPRSIPMPPIPPRKKMSIGEEGGVSSSLPNSSGSPSDRFGNSFRGRSISSSNTPAHILSKSPSVVSVNSTHSAVEELPLNDLLMKYSKNLPLKIRVSKGFLGVSEETAINTDDILKFHFMKHSKVVVMETAERVNLSVPMSSYLKFSILYNPNNNTKEAMNGFKFDTVGDLLAIKGTFPRVIRATRTFASPSPDACVAQDEIFILKQTKKSGKQLKVFSLTTGKKKTLHDNCAGYFTTAPEDIGIHLYELTVHAHECMPCSTVLYVRGKESSGVLGELHEKVVTLKYTTTESSVIATSGLCEEGESSDVYEMPVDLDIEVEAIAQDEYEQEALRRDTKYIYELFDPYSVILYIAKSSKRLYDIQCELYKAVNTELTALEIMRPHAITLGTKSSAPVQRSISSGTTGNGNYQPLTHKHNPGQCSDYYIVMSPNRQAANGISEHDSDVSGESTVSEHLSIMAHHSRGVDDNLTRVMEEVQGLRKEMAKMQVFTEHLRKFCESLRNQMRMMGTNPSSPGGVDYRAPALLPGEDNYSLAAAPQRQNGITGGGGSGNSSHVSQLNRSQVQLLLENVGMKQYVEMFEKERIDGEVLADMDDEMLTGLGIASKFHRMRLLKVIKGEHSAAKQIIRGESPPTTTEKKQLPESSNIYSIPRKRGSPTSQTFPLSSSCGSE